jgi:hypothetical protein
VAVAVNAVKGHAGAERLVDVHHLADGLLVAPAAVLGEEVPFEEKGERLKPVALAGELYPVRGLSRGPVVVDARAEPPEHGELLVGELVGHAAAGARPHGVEDAFHLAEGRSSRQLERGAHRDLVGAQIGQEAVLLQYLFARPAPGAVELGHHVRVVLQPEVVDPVLVAVERHAVPGRREAGLLQRAEYDVRREVEEEAVFGKPRLFVCHMPLSRVVEYEHPESIMKPVRQGLFFPHCC